MEELSATKPEALSLANVVSLANSVLCLAHSIQCDEKIAHLNGLPRPVWQWVLSAYIHVSRRTRHIPKNATRQQSVSTFADNLYSLVISSTSCCLLPVWDHQWTLVEPSQLYCWYPSPATYEVHRLTLATGMWVSYQSSLAISNSWWFVMKTFMRIFRNSIGWIGTWMVSTHEQYGCEGPIRVQWGSDPCEQFVLQLHILSSFSRRHGRILSFLLLLMRNRYCVFISSEKQVHL